MKQNIVNLFFIILPLFCDTLNNMFKKLLNKKLLSTRKYYERVNLFQCFKHCMNNENCDWFNYNKNLQACQLLDSHTDKHLEKIVYSNGWDIYFSTKNTKKEEPNLNELMVFNNELERNNVELDVNINSSYLTICFWFRFYYIKKTTVIFTMKNDQSCAYLQFCIDKNQTAFLKTNIDTTNQYNYANKLKRWTFHHICIVYNNGAATWYINGDKKKNHLINEIENNRIQVSKLLIGKAIKEYAGVCSDDEDMGFDGLLFDFNIFNRKLNISETKLLWTGKSTIPPFVSWRDVKNKFANLLNPVLKKVSIYSYYNIRDAYSKDIETH